MVDQKVEGKRMRKRDAIKDGTEFVKKEPAIDEKEEGHKIDGRAPQRSGACGLILIQRGKTNPTRTL